MQDKANPGPQKNNKLLNNSEINIHLASICIYGSIEAGDGTPYLRLQDWRCSSKGTWHHTNLFPTQVLTCAFGLHTHISNDLLLSKSQNCRFRWKKFFEIHGQPKKNLYPDANSGQNHMLPQEQHSSIVDWFRFIGRPKIIVGFSYIAFHKVQFERPSQRNSKCME